MRKRTRHIITVLLAGVAFPAAPLRAATKGENMGVFTELREEPAAGEIAALGLGWVRIMYHWTWLEQSEGKMNWIEFDQWMARAKAQHLKVLIVAQGSPAWANGGHGPYDRQSGLYFDKLAAQGIKIGPMVFFALHDYLPAQQANAIDGWEGIYDLQGAPKASVAVIKARAASNDR